MQASKIAGRKREVGPSGASSQPAVKKRKKSPGGLESMDVDQFLAGGFKEVVSTPAGAVKSDSLSKTNNAKQGAQVISHQLPTKGKSKAKGGKSAAKEHKGHLEALKTKDPEFYDYLKATDEDLLNFEDGDDVSDEESSQQEIDNLGFTSSSSDDEPESGGRPDDKPHQGPGILPTEAEERSRNKASSSTSGWGLLSQDRLGQWCKEAKESHSIAALEKLIKAYRVACHLGDDEEDMSATMRITSSTVFNKLLVFVIKEAGPLFCKCMALPEGRLTVDLIKKSKRWRKTENPVKSFLGNSLHLLSQMTDEAMIEFLLRHLRPSVPFLISSERTQRKFMKQVLQIFGEGGMKARVQAFLFIREMAVSLPSPNLTLAMKGVYRQFVMNAKFMSPGTLPYINFMANCVVDLYGLDTEATYETSFEYLRQIAIIVRGGLSQKTKEAYKEVYCWQTISSLELWAKVVATHAGQEDLRPIVHPITQLLVATVRLVPTPKYYPLRLRCIRALNKLSQATKLYVPVSTLLVESLHWSKLYKAAKPGGRKPTAVPQLRASKQELESTAFQQAYVEEVFLLLAEHLAQWSTNVAFPEMSFITSYQLSQLLKACKMEKMRSAVKGLNAAIHANAEYVVKERKRLDCSPKDTVILDKFMSSEAEQAKAPMRKYAVSLRGKWERQRALAAASDVQVTREEPAEQDDSADVLPDQDLILKLRKGGKPGKKTAAEPPDEQQAAHPDLDGEDVDEMEDDIKEFQLSGSDED